MGMFGPVPGLAGAGIWDARKFNGFDFALCAAALNPDATAADLDVSTDWLTWGTYGDDYFPTVFGRTRDMAGARTFQRAAVAVHADRRRRRAAADEPGRDAAWPTCGSAPPDR